MNDYVMMWWIFLSIMIPGNLLFNYWYQKDANASRVVSFAVGCAIGTVSMLISIHIVGWL